MLSQNLLNKQFPANAEKTDPFTCDARATRGRVCVFIEIALQAFRIKSKSALGILIALPDHFE